MIETTEELVQKLTKQYSQLANIIAHNHTFQDSEGRVRVSQHVPDTYNKDIMGIINDYIKTEVIPNIQGNILYTKKLLNQSIGKELKGFKEFNGGHND